MSQDQDVQHPLSILLAEDNVVNQRVAAALLTNIGHLVTICNNGREAVQAVAEGAFDIVLMDINMPVLDGLEATKEIRALTDPAKARIPIFAISGNVREEDMAHYRACGINEILTKPLRPERLRTLFTEQQLAENRPNRDEALLDAVHIAALREALLPEKLAELYQMARDSLEVTSQMLRKGWESDDPKQIKSAAHRLAGVARNFGCIALGNCAARIEDAANRGGTGKSESVRFERLLTASIDAMPGKA